MVSKLTVNLEKLSRTTNMAIPITAVVFGLFGYFFSFYFNFLTVFFIFLTLVNMHYLFIQKKHTLLSNFGVLAQMRYILESIGPEFRQYLYSNDTEERPFNRNQRSEIYKKSEGIDSSSAFGSQLNFDSRELKLRHSMYPSDKKDIAEYSLTFGSERGVKEPFTIHHPLMVSAMSYGALSKKAVMALSRGAKKSGIAMNTGEGGYPLYHLKEGANLIFQIGTAKFGVRKPDGSLDYQKLTEISRNPQVRMVELKFSQGAKPGKGGLLPKEKITKEISTLRGVPMGKDIISPPFHKECSSPEETIKFIRSIQEAVDVPVGIKLCLGKPEEFRQLIQAGKKLGSLPDYIAIDGAEGGTGAAPKSFMDDLGLPLLMALPLVDSILEEEQVRDRLKIVASGKLINAGRQFIALSLGADACYTARGFMFSLGCIQALHCNSNSCPVGITTHKTQLTKGLDIDSKSQRVVNYVTQLRHDYVEILAGLGKKSFKELGKGNLYIPQDYHEIFEKGLDRSKI